MMLVYSIPQTPSTLPANASHQVGIAAFVFNDDGQVSFGIVIRNLDPSTMANLILSESQIWNRERQIE